MARITSAHTADLAPGVLAAAHQLLLGAFRGDFDTHDWEHALGGMHVLAHDGDRLAGHAAVVQRRLLHGGRAWRTGYVEGVAVAADARGGGVGSALMAEAERIVRGGYELGALGSSDEAIAFYARRGWRRWDGPTFALTPAGRVRTADEDGGIFVLEVAGGLELAGELTCDWRDGSAW